LNRVTRALPILLTIVASLAVLPATAVEPQLEGTVTLSGAWAIYPTAVAWGEAFQRLHPGVKVDISAGGAGKGAADAIAGLVDIGMVSREPDPAEVAKGVLPVYVLHDAVFPVVSTRNPGLKRILERGIGRDTLVKLYVDGSAATWDAVLGSEVGRPVHVFTRSDSCGAASAWAAFFGKKQEDLKGVGVYGDPGILEAVKRDPVGLGYSNFSYVFARDGSVLEGLALAPVDANANGVADPDEVIRDRAAAVAAIESGRYPVARRNYLFVKGKPTGLVRAFLEFVLSDEGTVVVNSVGTSLPLPREEREKVLRSLQ
jgi:phosphate transport system substrate-binding protein